MSTSSSVSFDEGSFLACHEMTRVIRFEEIKRVKFPCLVYVSISLLKLVTLRFTFDVNSPLSFISVSGYIKNGSVSSQFGCCCLSSGMSRSQLQCSFKHPQQASRRNSRLGI